MELQIWNAGKYTYMYCTSLQYSSLFYGKWHITELRLYYEIIFVLSIYS